MLSVFKLLKVFFSEIFNRQFDNRGRNIKTKRIGILIVFLVIFLIYGYSLTYMFISSFNLLKNANINLNQIMFYPLMMINFVSLFFMLLSGNYLSLSERDMAVLGPLPIPEKRIVTAKLLMALIFESIFQIFLGITALIAVISVGGFSFTAYLSLILTSLLSSIVPLVVFSFIILLIKKAIYKSKHQRFFEIVSTFVLFGAIFLLSYTQGFGASQTNPENMLRIGDMFLSYYPFMFFVKMALESSNPLWLLLYAACNILLFYLYILIFYKFAYRLMIRTKYPIILKKKGALVYQEKEILPSLIKKEFGRMFGSTVYLTNILMMPLMMIIVSFVLIFNTNFKNQLLAVDFPVKEVFSLSIVFMTILFIFTPGFSMSLDWKYLWILKSLPIEPKTIFKAKIYFNLILQLSCCALIILFLSFAFQLKFTSIVFLIIFAIVSAVSFSIYYLFLNLRYPKTGVEDVYIIKQSTSVIIMSLTSIAIMMAEIFVAVLVYSLFNQFIFSVISLILLNGILGLIFFLILKKKGNYLFLTFS